MKISQNSCGLVLKVVASRQVSENPGRPQREKRGPGGMLIGLVPRSVRGADLPSKTLSKHVRSIAQTYQGRNAG